MAGTVARRDEAVVTTFDYESFPVFVEGIAGLAEALETNVSDGLRLTDLTRVPMPTGGGTSFEIPDELAGEPETVRSVRGSLVHWQPSRVYWDPPEEGQPEITHEAPKCSSADGKFPVEGGAFGDGGEYAHRNIPVMVEGRGMVRTCDQCPMAQFGSHYKEGSRRQACKSQILLFVVREGETLPTIITAPPTSLAVIRSAMVRLTAKYQTHFSQFVFDFSLERVTKGETYSKLVIRVAGVLEGMRKGRQGPEPGTPAAAARAYSDEFAAMLTPEAIIETAVGTGRNGDGDAGANGHRSGASVDDVIPDGFAEGGFHTDEEPVLS